MAVSGVFTHASGEAREITVPVVADGAGFVLDDNAFGLGPDAWSDPQDDGLTHLVYVYNEPAGTFQVTP